MEYNENFNEPNGGENDEDQVLDEDQILDEDQTLDEKQKSRWQILWQTIVDKFANYFTTRYKISLLLFFAAFNCYMLRVYFSSILILISRDVASSIYSSPECQRSNDDWNRRIAKLMRKQEYGYKGRRLTRYEETGSFMCFHGGHTISHFIASWIVYGIGPTLTVTIIYLIAGLFTLGLPYCVEYFVPGLFVIRFLTGFLTGFLVKCIHRIVLSWAPLTERKVFFNKCFGFHLGTVSSYIFSGLLLLNFSWQTVPIFMGISSLIFGFIWAAYASDDPEDHLFISDSEVDFIRMRLDLDAIQWFHHSSSKIKKTFPIKQVLKSRAVWAVFLTFWTHYWNTYFYLDYLPTFFFVILKIDIVPTNFIMALMHLSRLLVGLLSVYLAEIIISKFGNEYVSHTRKSITVFSHIVPGLLLILNSTAKCNRPANISMILAALILNGAFMGGALLNMNDLAPRYNTLLTDILDNVCIAVGFIVVCVYRLVDYYIPDPVDRWVMTTVINGLMYIFGGTVFILFGSAEVQLWDSPRERFENLRVGQSLIL